MQSISKYSFPRYLEAKKSVDDRALNRHVWDTLAAQLPFASKQKPLRVLEIGAGIGTMIERMLEWKMLRQAHYTALDSLPENAQAALPRLSKWAARQQMQIFPKAPYLWEIFDSHRRRKVEVEYRSEDLFAFIQQQSGQQKWDLLVAHAFLDLVDIPASLPLFKQLLSPGGSFYFSLNFDGATIFEPGIDPGFDRLIETLYHQSMDVRIIAGQSAGDSQAGRHLFSHLRQAGLSITGVGASDWVVYPTNGSYPHDEAFFLHFIINTIHQELKHHPDLESDRFEAWITKRHQQIEAAELIYIAHQIDYAGKLDQG